MRAQVPSGRAVRGYGTFRGIRAPRYALDGSVGQCAPGLGTSRQEMPAIVPPAMLAKIVPSRQKLNVMISSDGRSPPQP